MLKNYSSLLLYHILPKKVRILTVLWYNIIRKLFFIKNLMKKETDKSMGLLMNRDSDKSVENIFNASNKDEAIAALQDFKNSILEEATENYNLYGGKKVGMTKESREFYEGLKNKLNGINQAVSDPYLPVKDVEDVLQNIKTDSKLVSAVKTMSTDRAVVDIVLNGGGADKATFKPLTEAIVKEITGKVKVARVTLEKLSAYFQIAQDLCRFQSLAYLKNLLFL